MYRYELEFTEPLDIAEERQLIAQSQAGCKTSTGRLLAAMSGLVLVFAKRCRIEGVSRDEVVSEATHILLICITRFDPAFDVRLSSYVGKAWERTLFKRSARQRIHHLAFDDFTDADDNYNAVSPTDSEPSVPVKAITLEQQERVRGWLQRLEQGKRLEQEAAHVLRRRFFEAADWPTIQQELSLCSPSHAKQRMKYGLRRLKQFAESELSLKP